MGSGMMGMMGMMGGGYVPDTDPDPKGCSVCQKPNAKRCGGCKNVRFCSPACQRRAWLGGHKGKCKLLKHQLPQTARVIRWQSAALILNPENLVPPAAAAEAAADPAAGEDDDIEIGGEMFSLSELSACARAHLPTVLALTKDQLDHKYAAACEERWGTGMGTHPSIRLRDLLGERYVTTPAHPLCFALLT